MRLYEYIIGYISDNYYNVNRIKGDDDLINIY